MLTSVHGISLLQSETVDAGKRKAELEKQLEMQADHVASLKKRIEDMQKSLREDRIKMKQLTGEKAEQEGSHQQEIVREKAQVKALTDERASLIKRHNQEMTKLKVRLVDMAIIQNNKQ